MLHFTALLSHMYILLLVNVALLTMPLSFAVQTRDLMVLMQISGVYNNNTNIQDRIAHYQTKDPCVPASGSSTDINPIICSNNG